MNIDSVGLLRPAAPLANPVNGSSSQAGLSTPVAGPSPRTANFAQNMALDGASVKNLGAGAVQSLFQGGAPASMGAPAPTLTQSGFDMDRAFKLTSEKISAGKTDGADFFAAHLAEVGEK